MKERVPRKIKKWHRKRGWKLHFGYEGDAYWTRDTPLPFRHGIGTAIELRVTGDAAGVMAGRSVVMFHVKP